MCGTNELEGNLEIAEIAVIGKANLTADRKAIS
jgi:hypothetical protein